MSFFVDTVADDGDLVIDHWECNFLRVDTTVVGVLPIVGGVDTAGDWAVGVELSLHLLSTTEGVVLTNVEAEVWLDTEAVLKAIITWAWWAPKAVTADINILWLLLQVVGNILFTAAVDETVSTGIGVDIAWVSTVARATSLLVNNNLSVQSNWGWDFQVSQDVESVSNGRG